MPLKKKMTKPLRSSMVGRSDARRRSGAQDTMMQAGLPAGTLVATASGDVPIEYLNPGDRIVTRSAGLVRVDTVTSQLARTRFVAVNPGALGVRRPNHAALLPASQPVLLRDGRASAVYGQSNVIVAVGELADGDAIIAIGQRTSVLLSLNFADPQIIYADGMELAISSMAGEMARAA
ncbi:MAG: Hint domain-containing protein [Rhodobacteraceae bacterium]|nr:Hint domain-containing protein [Paracoccaceae bacterium]